MHFSLFGPTFVVLAALSPFSTPVFAQSFTSCNPLTTGKSVRARRFPSLAMCATNFAPDGCPPNPALGRSVNIDFTKGASESFTPQGNPSYGPDGVAFTVAKSGDSPQLNSKWYIMFGHVEFVVKAARGAGIVSSAVLQSDCLDEIDWEWLGGDNRQIQSNYFGKAITTTYNRGAFHDATGNQDSFHTYTIDWTSKQIVWQIDGVTVRALTQENAAKGQYPQTPMMVKIGAWSGGDPANQPGTIGWAGGPTNYADGPFTMYVRSVAVTDYSTGTQYKYYGSDGTWQSIQSTGGSINPDGGSETPTDASNAPAITSAASSAPIPFEGTHRDDSSTWVTPSVWPWVGSATATLRTSVSTASATTYPGLPSGWIVMEDGRVLPPSNAAPIPSSSTLSHTSSHFVLSDARHAHADILIPHRQTSSLHLVNLLPCRHRSHHWLLALKLLPDGTNKGSLSWSRLTPPPPPGRHRMIQGDS